MNENVIRERQRKQMIFGWWNFTLYVDERILFTVFNSIGARKTLDTQRKVTSSLFSILLYVCCFYCESTLFS